MSKIQEKVKDIVEVRPYDVVSDFINQPALTISNYHFTDATSEMMVRWLDEIARVGATGACRAVAGYRGVGKSHFLAVLSTIASHPEMRSKITDSHVAGGAQRLLRRHYPVLNVRRGRFETLFQELVDAACVAFSSKSSAFGTTAEAALDHARQLAGDLPLIVLIDTDVERTARVARNDGQILSEMAEIATKKGIFVGLALDDDISQADGTNVSLVSTFSIDYLDQEQIHKVVNARIFPKNTRMQGVITEMYSYFRDVIPQFRWSEQRFTALYPLHPATLEVAPFIRLHVPEFSLLRFASDAGEKILGRPADSLIGLEDMFDGSESALRKVSELKTAFETYDQLSESVISGFPVADRHRARLILKALILLSLDGRGTTAGELSASTMIFDPGNPELPEKEIGSIIEEFKNALPGTIHVLEGQNAQSAFLIGSGTNDLNRQLAMLAANAPRSEARKVFNDALVQRFQELTPLFSESSEKVPTISTDLIWRGSIRPGVIHTGPDTIDESSSESVRPEWKLLINFGDRSLTEKKEEATPALIEWCPDGLSADEEQTLISFAVLKSNEEFRAQFSDQLSAAHHSYASAVETIVERSMFADGQLAIGGFDYNFSETARSASSISEVMSVMLEPLFESRFPDHPYFPQLLARETVDEFVSKVLSGSQVVGLDARESAVSFGLPLKIVKEVNGGIELVQKDELLETPLTKRIYELISADKEKSISFESVRQKLAEAPVGLAREPLYLLLATLASKGLIEFVTRSGDRINGRSLDLKVEWSEIVELRCPRIDKVSTETLQKWGQIIANDPEFSSFSSAADRGKVLSSLVDIASRAKTQDLRPSISGVLDSDLNTEMWKHAENAAEGFGPILNDVENTLLGNLELEECIVKISEHFGGSAKRFHTVSESVGKFEAFASSYPDRRAIENYLMLLGSSIDKSLLSERDSLTRAVNESIIDPSEPNNRALRYAWEKFLRIYSEWYVTTHRDAMRSRGSSIELTEIKESTDWRIYTRIVRSLPIRKKYFARLTALKRDLEMPACSADPEALLAAIPFCICGFRENDHMPHRSAVSLLRSEIRDAADEFDELVARQSDEIITAIEADEGQITSLDISFPRLDLLEYVTGARPISDLTNDQLDFLVEIADKVFRNSRYRPSTRLPLLDAQDDIVLNIG